MFGIKLGTKEEIEAIFNGPLYSCFKAYELPSSLITPRAAGLLGRARSEGVKFTAHAPHPFNSSADMASADEDMRESSVKEIMAAMDAAALIAPEAFVVHCGVTNNSRCGNHADGERTRREALSTARRSLREIADYALPLNLHLTIENDAALPGIKAVSNGDRAYIGTLCTTPEEVSFMLDSVSGVGLTFDVGHAYGTANWLKREPYRFMESMIKSAGAGRVKNIHITDIEQGVDFHMAIGKGTIDFKKVFKVLSGYSGPVILEIFPQDIFASIEEIRGRYSILDPEELFDMGKIRAFCNALGWGAQHGR